MKSPLPYIPVRKVEPDHLPMAKMMPWIPATKILLPSTDAGKNTPIMRNKEIKIELFRSMVVFVSIFISRLFPDAG